MLSYYDFRDMAITFASSAENCGHWSWVDNKDSHSSLLHNFLGTEKGIGLVSGFLRSTWIPLLTKAISSKDTTITTQTIHVSQSSSSSYICSNSEEQEIAGNYQPQELTELEDNTLNMNDFERDIACLYCMNDNDDILCRFHIVYHNTYQVPLLFFQPSLQDGCNHCSILDSKLPRFLSLLFPDRVNNIRVINDINDSREEQMISQMEHPVLGIPCWCFHPCQTASIMKLFFWNNEDERKKGYLPSWLRYVCSFIGLTIRQHLLHDVDRDLGLI